MSKWDKLTSAEVAMSFDHSQIHEERGFSLIFNTGSIAGDATYKTLLTTPASSTSKRIHLRPSKFSASANIMQIAIYEDSTNTGGTTVQPINHNRGTNPAVSLASLKTNVTAALTGKNLTAATAGGNFANQPAGDSVEVVSSNNADKGQILTIYGTKTGATATVTTETIVLNGTTAVASATTTWQNILGLELSAACAGTVTVREGSGDATIITFSAGDLSKGVVTIADSRGRDAILRAIGSGASTAPVGAIGTSPSGAAVTSVIALNGTNSVNLNSDVFRTITKFLNGAVASTVNVTFSRPEVMVYHDVAGSGGAHSRSGGGVAADEEIILESGIDYIVCITNGSTTASVGYARIFYYEEPY